MNSLEFLKSSGLAEGVKRQIDPLSPNKVRFWLDKLECVTNRPRDEIETDGTLSWLPFLRETYTEVRRRLFGLLKGVQDTVTNGYGEEVVPLPRSGKDSGTFVWTNAPDPPLPQQLETRGWPAENLRMLGPQFGILNGHSFSSVKKSLHPMMQSSPKKELLGMIASIEKVIAIIEEYYPQYDELLTKNDGLISPHLREQVHAPAKLIELNRRNPFKNWAKVWNEISEGRDVHIPDLHMFLYRLMPQPSDSRAGFSFPERTLYGSPKIDGSLFEMNHIQHEMTHANQDAVCKENLDRDEYSRIYGPDAIARKTIVFADECAAFALQIEGLNAVLNGALEHPPVDLSKVSQILRTDPKGGQFQTFKVLAEYYFEGGRWQESGAFPAKLAYSIKKHYESKYKFRWNVRDAHGCNEIQDWEEMIGKKQLTADGMLVVIENCDFTGGQLI